MNTRILIDDGSVDGAYNIEGEIIQLDEYLKVQIDKIKMYIPISDALAASGYTEEHG